MYNPEGSSGKSKGGGMWLQAAQLGAGVLSGVLGARGEAKRAKAEARQRKAEFDATQAMNNRRMVLDEETHKRRSRGLSRTSELRDSILRRVMGGGKIGGGDPPPRPRGDY